MNRRTHHLSKENYRRIRTDKRCDKENVYRLNIRFKFRRCEHEFREILLVTIEFDRIRSVTDIKTFCFFLDTSARSTFSEMK